MSNRGVPSPPLRTFPGGFIRAEDRGAPHEQVVVAVWARAAPIRGLSFDRLRALDELAERRSFGRGDHWIGGDS